MTIYPLLMAPCFRHGIETPWGGNVLRDIFMKDAPDEITGESLEVSVLPGYESMIGNGEHAGKPLSRVVELWGEALTGTQDGSLPLLLKLIDAQKPLSVQVYPDHPYALEHEGKPGKSEAWVILEAEPGAKIVYGVDADGADLGEAVAQGRLAGVLHWENVRPGDVFHIPAGLVHAIGEGVLCYVIQTSSDVIYRLWDWDRPGLDGKPRELHVKKALDVVEPGLHLKKNEGTTVLCKGGSRTYYISDKNFELCRLNVSGRMPLDSGRMLLLTAMGPCALRWNGGEMEIAPFASVIVPAALEGAVIEGETKVLMSCLPNREALIKELGYRAENVSGLLD